MLELIKKLKSPIMLLAILLLPMLLGKHISSEIKALFYTLSLTIKGVLLTVLPFIIFSFVFSCLLGLQGRVLSFALILICTVFVSNYLAVIFGYAFGSTLLPLFAITMDAVDQPMGTLEPMWSFPGVVIIKNEIALIMGFAFGILFSIKRNAKIDALAQKLSGYANMFLKQFFLPVLPLFILGFVLKMEHDNILAHAFSIYGPLFMIFAVGQLLYILALFFVAAGFDAKQFLLYLRNILPAAITGLTTFSSAASMPSNIIAAEKNTGSLQAARMLIPATVNIHMLGTGVGLNILILGAALAFGYLMPSWEVYLMFAFYYALAQYAAAGVPGGAIIIMAPLMETYLGYSPEMVGLATALCLLFDPIDTSFNVSGNGGFAIIFHKLFGKKLSLAAEPKTLQAANSTS